MTQLEHITGLVFIALIIVILIERLIIGSKLK